MKNLKLILLASTVSVFILSCVEGPTGPQGLPGNANVISDEYNVLSTAWSYDATNEEWYVDVPDADITSGIAAGGVVEVFLETNSNPVTFTALPYTYYYSTSVSIANTYTFTAGQFELDETASTLNSNYAPATNIYNVVAISADGINKAKQGGIDLKDFEQVSKLAGAKVMRVTSQSPNIISDQKGNRISQ